MKRSILFLSLLLVSLCSFCSAEKVQNVKGGKCEASINGKPIKYIYIIGDQYNGVVWAYKHIAEETCLLPTTEKEKADAILVVNRSWTPEYASSTSRQPSRIDCTSSRNSVTCTDDIGNEMTTVCNNGVCSSTYGPSLYSAVSAIFSQWLSTRSWDSNAYLYSLDNKLLWSSTEQKARWVDSLWYDKLRLGTNSPTCQLGAWHSRHGMETFRKLATKKCNLEFDPLVSIDIKLKAKEAETQAVKE